MNYDSVLKKLEELMVALVEKGIAIPPDIIEDLKSGRSLLSVYKIEQADLDLAMESNPVLQKTELALLCLADSEAGKEYADAWQRKISMAYTEEEETSPKRPVFISGIPKGEHWIRIKTSEFLNDNELNELLEKYELSYRREGDGYLLVHGKKESVLLFLKKVRDKINKNHSEA